jgi:AcrR family transcriptional regulator
MTIREPNPRGAGDQLRSQLVAAASDLLLTTQAVALPSLRAVARACAVSPAAVYLHFDSVQALLSAVIDAQLQALEAAIHEEVDATDSAAQQLVQLACSYVRWGLDHPGAYQLLFESAERLEIPDHDLDDPSWKLIDETSGIFAAAAGLEAAPAREGAFRLWAAMHGIVSLRIHKPGVPWPDAVTEVSAVVSRSLAF